MRQIKTLTGLVAATAALTTAMYVGYWGYLRFFVPPKYHQYYQIDNITQVIRENDGYIIVRDKDQHGEVRINKYCSREIGDSDSYIIKEIYVPEEVKKNFRNKAMLIHASWPGQVSIYKDLPQGSRGFANVVQYTAWGATPCKGAGYINPSRIGEHVEIHLPPNQDITFR